MKYRRKPFLSILAFSIFFSLHAIQSLFSNPAPLESDLSIDINKDNDGLKCLNTLNDLMDALMERLIATAEGHFREGEHYLQVGKIDKARASFDAAVRSIASSDVQLRSAPKVQEYSKDLMRRIGQRESAYMLSSGDVPETSSIAEEGREEDAQAPKYDQALIDEVESLNTFPIVIDPKLRDLVGEDIANTAYDIPIVLNERVLQFLNYFQTRGRDRLQEGLLRSGRYKEMIFNIFDEEGLPRDMMYMALIESLFKPLACSRARAKGMWQFMTTTGKLYGLRKDKWIDERADPERSTRAAARFTRDLYEEFEDWYLVMAGYNAGKGAVQRAIDRAGTRDFWELAQRRYLPRETVNHIPAILAGIIIAKNPEKYGFTNELAPPLHVNKVKVLHPTDLKLISKLSNVPLETIRQLNPELTSMSTPRNYPDYELKLPADTGNALMASLSRIPPQQRLTTAHYKAHGSRKISTVKNFARRSNSSPADSRKSSARNVKDSLAGKAKGGEKTVHKRKK